MTFPSRNLNPALCERVNLREASRQIVNGFDQTGGTGNLAPLRAERRQSA